MKEKIRYFRKYTRPIITTRDDVRNVFYKFLQEYLIYINQYQDREYQVNLKIFKLIIEQLRKSDYTIRTKSQWQKLIGLTIYIDNILLKHKKGGWFFEKYSYNTIIGSSSGYQSLKNHKIFNLLFDINTIGSKYDKNVTSIVFKDKKLENKLINASKSSKYLIIKYSDFHNEPNIHLLLDKKYIKKRKKENSILIFRNIFNLEHPSHKEFLNILYKITLRKTHYNNLKKYKNQLEKKKNKFLKDILFESGYINEVKNIDSVQEELYNYIGNILDDIIEEYDNDIKYLDTSIRFYIIKEKYNYPLKIRYLKRLYKEKGLNNKDIKKYFHNKLITIRELFLYILLNSKKFDSSKNLSVYLPKDFLSRTNITKIGTVFDFRDYKGISYIQENLYDSNKKSIFDKDNFNKNSLDSVYEKQGIRLDNIEKERRFYIKIKNKSKLFSRSYNPIQFIKKEIKEYVFGEDYLDFDLNSANVQLLLTHLMSDIFSNLSNDEKNTLKPHIQYLVDYIINKKNIITKISQDLYILNNDDVKTILTSITFGKNVRHFTKIDLLNNKFDKFLLKLVFNDVFLPQKFNNNDKDNDYFKIFINKFIDDLHNIEDINYFKKIINLKAFQEIMGKTDPTSKEDVIKFIEEKYNRLTENIRKNYHIQSLYNATKTLLKYINKYSYIKSEYDIFNDIFLLPIDKVFNINNFLDEYTPEGLFSKKVVLNSTTLRKYINDINIPALKKSTKEDLIYQIFNILKKLEHPIAYILVFYYSNILVNYKHFRQNYLYLDIIKKNNILTWQLLYEKSKIEWLDNPHKQIYTNKKSIVANFIFYLEGIYIKKLLPVFVDNNNYLNIHDGFLVHKYDIWKKYKKFLDHTIMPNRYNFTIERIVKNINYYDRLPLYNGRIEIPVQKDNLEYSLKSIFTENQYIGTENIYENLKNYKIENIESLHTIKMEEINTKLSHRLGINFYALIFNLKPNDTRLEDIYKDSKFHLIFSKAIDIFRYNIINDNKIKKLTRIIQLISNMNRSRIEYHSTLNIITNSKLFNKNIIKNNINEIINFLKLSNYFIDKYSNTLNKKYFQFLLKKEQYLNLFNKNFFNFLIKSIIKTLKYIKTNYPDYYYIYRRILDYDIIDKSKVSNFDIPTLYKIKNSDKLLISKKERLEFLHNIIFNFTETYHKYIVYL